ncbi:MAG: electron transfer flavoprotein subunit beta/FixA family protein [Synergistaceae bacterium]|nr:electron transfer flavoprotein subunit beta/FixA family protein [Synergistaceae bacterium]
MKLAVLIKQVPAVDTVRINEATGVMEREGVESELNPPDLHALEAAIRIKEENSGVKVTAITMGPAQARKILLGAIAMGCDDAVLLSDRKFAGADTLATARTLAAAVDKLGGFDAVFSGERATDGETGQVAPAVAELLGVPALTYVSGIKRLTPNRVVVERAIEGGHESIASPLPAVLSVTKEINRPRLTTLGGKLRAKGADIPVYDAASLGLDDSGIGFKGSPTRVSKVMYPKVTRTGEKFFMAEDAEGTIKALSSFLSDNAFLTEETSL